MKHQLLGCNLRLAIGKREVLFFLIILLNGCGASRAELSPESFGGVFNWTNKGCEIVFQNNSSYDLQDLQIRLTFHFTDGSTESRTEHWKSWKTSESKRVAAIEKDGQYLVAVVGMGDSSAYRIRFGALLADETNEFSETVESDPVQ